MGGSFSLSNLAKYYRFFYSAEVASCLYLSHLHRLLSQPIYLLLKISAWLNLLSKKHRSAGPPKKCFDEASCT
jgi:hypothetical protein